MYAQIKYELGEIERMLAESVERSIPDETVLQGVEREIERIKQVIVHEVFAFGDERHLERYIQYHQAALIRIMNKVDLATTQDEQSTDNEVNKLVYKSLEDLLSFIERHFTRYFDQDANAPLGYISITKKELKANLKKLQKAFTGLKVDHALIELFCHVLKKILHAGDDHGVTYRRILYAKEIQKELFRFIERTHDGLDEDEELRQIMYYLNYNSTRVLAYHAQYISSQIEKSETRAEKIERLSYILKRINQAQVKPGVRYHTHGSSLKEQLNIYISEEIDYQERLQQLSANNTQPGNDSQLPGFQLKFDASVAQLAYLLKVLLETKTILNNNLSQIIHFMVKYAITKRSELLSYGSFRTKYYAVEDSTKESVRAMLVRWIEYIDRT